MPLKVTCACGKKLVASDDLAGKRTKCPHCGAVLMISAEEKTEASEASNAKRDAPSNASSQAPETEYALSNAVWAAPTGAPAPAPPQEEYALQAAAPRAVVAPFTAARVERAANTCPDCGKVLADNAVLCVGCGFDLRSGKKLGTSSLDKGAPDRGPWRPKPDRR